MHPCKCTDQIALGGLHLRLGDACAAVGAALAAAAQTRVVSASLSNLVQESREGAGQERAGGKVTGVRPEAGGPLTCFSSTSFHQQSAFSKH